MLDTERLHRMLDGVDAGEFVTVTLATPSGHQSYPVRRDESGLLWVGGNCLGRRAGARDHLATPRFRRLKWGHTLPRTFGEARDGQ